MAVLSRRHSPLVMGPWKSHHHSLLSISWEEVKRSVQPPFIIITQQRVAITKKGINFNIILMKISLWSEGNNQYNYDLLDLGPSASQSSDGDASAASRILVVSFLQVCLFWATDLKCSRSFRLVSFSLSSDTRVRSLLRTTGSVVKGRPLNLLPCDKT